MDTAQPRAAQAVVLMPCRALEAFRRGFWATCGRGGGSVLMPCRALEAFRLVAGLVVGLAAWAISS